MTSDIVERLRDYDAEDEARNVLPPCGLIAEAAAEIESLRSQLADYELLKRAVNESGDCLPDCDANAHNEQCPNVNNHVVMQDQRREIEALRDERALIVARAENAEAALAETESDRDAAFRAHDKAHAACIHYDEMLTVARELLGEAREALRGWSRDDGTTEGDCPCSMCKNTRLNNRIDAHLGMDA